MWYRRLAFGFVLFCGVVRVASGIILVDTGDPTVNTSTPGDNSGWQYEGQFAAFLGTPIAPLYFITAHHIGGYIGQSFTFHGETFTTTAGYADVDKDGNLLTDLQIWKVDHAFACYAPLYDQNGSEPGQELHVFGRGTQRGGEIDLNGTPRGWGWGSSDSVERWGRNLVTAVLPNDSVNAWYLLQATFDHPGLVHEAHLSVGDSGGGLFILEGGLWRLAGINYAVDDLWTTADPGTAFVAAIYDARGYYTEDANGNNVLIPDDGVNVPTSFYSTQISSRLPWIESVVGVDPSTLPAENFGSWQQAYFTPAQIGDSTVSGPNADPDGDGISNLLEFAFNLDPTYAEPVVMTAGTGLRGLPLIRIESVAAADMRLTVEFVRRTAGSGSGVTYTVQFASGLGANANWQATTSSPSVTQINARWERVKVTDTVSAGITSPTRFARVSVTQTVGDSPQAHARVLVHK